MHSPLSKQHHLHGIRVILFGISLVALCLVRVDPVLFTKADASGSVLAYATNTSIGDLTAYTNSARAQNGLGAVSLNSKLNNSAQAKANDMIARDYWAHNTPDGTQPWWFFEQAGYSYSRAGENLAYGFADSNSTVNAWMNSPSHRDNVLGSYSEVGFGIASGAAYQGGENTVVVAHYATPFVTPPSPPPSTPQVQSTTPSTPVTPTETPVPTTPVAEPIVPTTQTTNEQKKDSTPKTPVNTSMQTTSVPLWQTFQGGSIPLIGVVSLLLLAIVAIGYGLTHRSLVRHALITSENYALHHPAVDASILIAMTLLVLLTTVGRIG